MAKEREKQSAYLLYVVQLKPANEVAALCKVQPKTVGDWIKKGNWKAERNAKLNNSKNQADRVKDLIDSLSEVSIGLLKELDKAKREDDKEAVEFINKQLVANSQQVAMYNKTLQNIDKDAKISLGIYIEIMEMIFSDLQVYDYATYMKTLDFQAQHLNTASVKFG